MAFNINDFNKNNRDSMLDRLSVLRETKNWDISKFDTKEKIIAEIDNLKSAKNREDMPSIYYENIEKHLTDLKKALLDHTKTDVKTITESVLDPIQKYRCDSLFGPKNKEESPKMLNSAREFLINLAEKFIKDIDIPGAKIEEFFMVGSSLGYQYRENADIDCDLRINISKKDMEGKWSFCPKGIIYPDSAHPVNIFVLCSDDKPYNFEEDCENAYDILKNKWIKQGKLSNQDPIPFEHVAGISQFIMDGITLELERARRNIDQANMYLKLDSSRFEISEKERDDALADKIADLQMDADALKLAHHFLFKLDVEGFNREDFGISIAYTAQSKHYTINNLIYKYVDRFGYYDKINETTKQIWETIDKIKSGIKSDTGNDQEEQMKTEIEKEVLKEAEDVESVNDKTTVLNNLRSDIQDEYTAIKGYDAHADFAEKNNYPDIAKILRDIRDEEKVHVGELEAIVKKYDKEFKDSLADGGKEAEEILKEDREYLEELFFKKIEIPSEAKKRINFQPFKKLAEELSMLTEKSYNIEGTIANITDYQIVNDMEIAERIRELFYDSNNKPTIRMQKMKNDWSQYIDLGNEKEKELIEAIYKSLKSQNIFILSIKKGKVFPISNFESNIIKEICFAYKPTYKFINDEDQKILKDIINGDFISDRNSNFLYSCFKKYIPEYSDIIIRDYEINKKRRENYEKTKLTENREYTQYVKGHIKNLKSGYRWMKKYLPELFPKGYFDKENRNIRSAIRNHDKSKWGKDEYKAYSDFQEIRKRTDLSDEEYDSMKGEFNKAWNHHQKGNKHHWQYWVLQNADGSTKVLDMPYENIIEMICDWWTFSWKDNNLKSIFEWYEKNKNQMILSPKTRQIVEDILRKMKKKISEQEKNGTLKESFEFEVILENEINESFFDKIFLEAYYKTCPDCGANLDPGEKCDCKMFENKKPNENLKETSNKKQIKGQLEIDLKESRLPQDGSDPEYGIPELKKYPLFDKNHVISAIKLFGHVEPKYEGKLAQAIIRKMRKYNIPFNMVSEDNKLYKYI